MRCHWNRRGPRPGIKQRTRQGHSRMSERRRAQGQAQGCEWRGAGGKEERTGTAQGCQWSRRGGGKEESPGTAQGCQVERRGRKEESSRDSSRGASGVARAEG